MENFDKGRDNFDNYFVIFQLGNQNVAIFDFRSKLLMVFEKIFVNQKSS